MTAPHPRLEADGLYRRFAGRAVVNDVSVSIGAGEVLCLLGPSGCGKSTTLRILAGVEMPERGTIRVDGAEVFGPRRSIPPEDRSVGLMFQDFALFPHLTILDNVRFGLTALSSADGKREALAALDRVGMVHYADNYPHALSGGEQQRVALARALAPRPAVLLMDEPFSGLDSRLKDSVRAETLAILREARATAIVVTHDAEEAMRMGDRI
ncbi:MAG: ABC transporter ATP-binding protein, partial [Rhodobacteraceae bacterium]|nr:ABC transporter ATP-binding protein [Paracoccaceae bacterium]